MANTIQIKHGSSEPENGILQPYELGYNINNNGLYIGLPDGTAKKINEIQVIDRVANADNADKAKESDKASKDSKDQIITETYIKDIKIEDQTVTITKGDDSSFTQTTKDTTYDIATKEKNGLLSKEDKDKLDSIDTGANKIIVDSSLSSTSLNPVQNKVIYEALKDAGGISLLYDSGGWTGDGVGQGAIPLSGTGYQVLAIVAGGTQGTFFSMLESNYGITLYSYDLLSSTWCKREFYFIEDYDDMTGELTTFFHFGDCTNMDRTKNFNTHLQPLKIYKVM